MDALSILTSTPLLSRKSIIDLYELLDHLCDDNDDDNHWWWQLILIVMVSSWESPSQGHATAPQYWLINITIIIFLSIEVIIALIVIVISLIFIIITIIGSNQSWLLYFSGGYHISQACTIIFLPTKKAKIFRAISIGHIFLLAVGHISRRKFINIVVSLMVRLKRRKWILAIQSAI